MNTLKTPAICFIALSVTLLLCGAGTLGGMVILFNSFPAGAPVYLVPLLGLNGLLCLILSGVCGLAAWRLLKQRPKMKAFAGFAWALVAGFIGWNLLVEFLAGWSTGGLVMIVIWGVLEAVIARGLRKTEMT